MKTIIIMFLALFSFNSYACNQQALNTHKNDGKLIMLSCDCDKNVNNYNQTNNS